MDEKVTERLDQALQLLVNSAIRVASYAHANVSAEHWDRVRKAIDSGEAALCVQVDLPSATVSVLVDGELWAAPQCLLRLELPERETRAPPPAA